MGVLDEFVTMACGWLLSFVAYGYKRAEAPASNLQISIGSRISAALAFPIFWLAVVAGRIYGMFKYRHFLF